MNLTQTQTPPLKAVKVQDHHPQVEAVEGLRQEVVQKVVLKTAKNTEQDKGGDLDQDHSQIEANQKREHRLEEEGVFRAIDSHSNL